MRIYFTACTQAILKLNGEYFGKVDLFERYTEILLCDSVLAEIVPGGNLQPVNFFLDEKLLSGPPDFLNVYLGEGEAVLYVKKFESRSQRISVVCQTRFSGNLVTVFSQGEIYLCAEGGEYSLTPLGKRFAAAHMQEHTLSGRPVLAVYGDGAVVVLSETGKKIFSREAEKVVFGERLTVRIRFETCTAAVADCEYEYTDGELRLAAAHTAETFSPCGELMHFAFFESVLVRADAEKYLSDELRGKAGMLKEYLGEFAGVTVPTRKFYEEHPHVRAAGLVYPKADNLFEIRYFAVTVKDGKIDNVYPV